MQIKSIFQKLFFSLFLSTIMFSELHGLNSDYWSVFKRNFITPEGRVIDRYNQDITHTESIGYGMFFAVSYGDQKTFYLVREWLKKNMSLGQTNLYGWKWGKNDKGEWGMLDPNNATDGDMWIAYSMLLAYEKWKDNYLLQEAKSLIKSIKENTIIKYNGKVLLLPAQFGFNKDDYIKLNPSYTIPFIFEKFAHYDNDPIWKTLIYDSVDMFQNSALGNLKIHPDWIKIDKSSKQYTYFGDESIFGFDSIRTPLFIAYYYKLTKDDNFKSILTGYKIFLEYVKKLDKYIYQIDFKNNKIRYQNPPYGFLAVYKYLYNQLEISAPSTLQTKIEEGLKNETNNYYSFSLLLFTDIFN